MTIGYIRLMIFYSWIATWVIAIALVFSAALLRNDGAIGAEQMVPAIRIITPIWLPVLSCFGAFWFLPAQGRQNRRKRLNKERATGAFVLTYVYLLMILFLVAHAAWLADYSAPEYESVGDTLDFLSFTDYLEQTVVFVLWISPLATAPVIWLTGETPKP